MPLSHGLKKLAGAILAAGFIMAVGLIPLAGLGSYVVAQTDKTMQSNVADMKAGTTPGVTTIKDAEGNTMAWIYDQRRYPVPSEKIAQSTKDAIVAIEDRRFYEHDGVDLQGALRALITDIVAGSVEQGASTLNQQYVKNYLLLVHADTDSERAKATETSIVRKLREMKMAADLDATLTKDEILTRYLNLVPFGNGAYGIEAAAETYFDKKAIDLSVPESALLTGILQSSSALNPYTNPEGATQRRNTVLDAMVTNNKLAAADAERFKQEPLGVIPEPKGLPSNCISAGDRGFFCDYVLDYLSRKGYDRDKLLAGSYTITTTLDPATQDAVRQSAINQVSPTAEGVASVMNVIEPNDARAVKAMVSSRNYGLDADNKETMLPMTYSMTGNGAGSIFKIFTAAAALESGTQLSSQVSTPARIELSGMGVGGAKNCPPGLYCVQNSGNFASSMTLAEALAQSPNTTFVKLLQKVGVPRVVDIAVALGLRSYTDPGTYDGEKSVAQSIKDDNSGSFTLGPTPVNPLELSNVAASIADDGKWCEPNPIKSMVDAQGKEVPLERPKCEQAISKSVANTLASGLTGDTTHGTAKAAASAYKWTSRMSGKTGTTESHQSAAFMGFNSNFAAAVYIFNDGSNPSPICTSPARQCTTGTIYGGQEPARTWFGAASNLSYARAGTSPSPGNVFGSSDDSSNNSRDRTNSDNGRSDSLSPFGLDDYTYPSPPVGGGGGLIGGLSDLINGFWP